MPALHSYPDTIRAMVEVGQKLDPDFSQKVMQWLGADQSREFAEIVGIDPIPTEDEIYGLPRDFDASDYPDYMEEL